MTIIPLDDDQGGGLPDWLSATFDELITQEERTLVLQKRRVRHMRREHRRVSRREVALRTHAYSRPILLWTGATAFTSAMAFLAYGESHIAMELLEFAVAAWAAFVAVPPQS